MRKAMRRPIVLLTWLMTFALAGLPACAATILRVDATAQPAAPETGYLHMGTSVSPGGLKLDVNSRYMTVNGKPWLPVAGEFHYSRFDHRYWDEELAKMKSSGVDIVSTYVFWNHIEAHEGHFDWTGDRDLRRFVTLANKNGLKVLLRIGPWAHGEARFGGLPDWIVKSTRIRGNHPAYLHYVARYYDQIGQQVKGLLWKDGGPIIAVQLENEYYARGEGEGPAHIAKLKELARAAGLDVPIYTVTGFHDSDNFPPREVIPMQGGYADQPWAFSTEKLAPSENYRFRLGTFWSASLGADTHLMSSRENTTRHVPFFSAEFGGGLPDMYRRRPQLSADDTAAMLPVELGSGINWYGYYMFHGGEQSPDHDAELQESTASGYPNDMPLIDYDYQAPLGAFGQQRESLNKIRPVHYFLNSFGAGLAPMQAHKPDVAPDRNDDFTTPRFDVRTLGDSGYLFFNNHIHQYAMAQQRDIQFQVVLPSQTLTFPTRPITVGDAYFIWPINMDLGAARLAWATAQSITRLSGNSGTVSIFRAVKDIPVELAFDGASAVNAPSGTVSRQGGRIIVSDLKPGSDALVTVTGKGGAVTRLLILTAGQGEHVYLANLQGRERLILTQGQLYTEDGKVNLLSNGSSQFDFSVFPRLAKAPSGNLPVTAAGANGVFQRFTSAAPARDIVVKVTQTRQAGPMPPPLMTGMHNTVVVPTPETFSQSAAWSLELPKNPLAGLNDVFLEIKARGDVGRLFSDGWLADDHFFSGATWEIGLKQFADRLDKPMTLTILPLRKDTPIYLDNGVASMVTGDQTAELQDIRAVSQYRLTLDGAAAR
jgi:beta-galactosidase